MLETLKLSREDLNWDEFSPKIEARGRKWSEREFKKFASVLVDDKTEFALTTSDTLLLKNAANVYAFENTQKELDTRICLHIRALKIYLARG